MFGVNGNGLYAPTDIVAGDTTKFNTGFDAFTPEGGWICNFKLAGSGSLQVSGMPVSSSWNFTLPATQTATLPPGLYTFAYIMTQNGEQYTVKSGRLYVKPSIAAANPGDLVSQNQRILNAINNTIEGRANDDAQTITLFGKAISYLQPEMLLKMKAQYEYLVYMERNTSQQFGKPVSTNHLGWF